MVIKSLIFLIKSFCKKSFRKVYAETSVKRLLQKRNLDWLVDYSTTNVEYSRIMFNGRQSGRIINKQYIVLEDFDNIDGYVAEYIIKTMRYNPRNKGVWKFD